MNAPDEKVLGRGELLPPEFQPIGKWSDTIGDYRGALVIPETQDGRILLQMRDDVAGIAMPGQWGFFGGGIEADEDPKSAVAREFLEETGIDRPQGAFKPRFAVLTGPPRWGLLYVFHYRLDVHPKDIRVLEGAGFALATRAQAQKLDLIWYVREVLENFWQNE